MQGSRIWPIATVLLALTNLLVGAGIWKNHKRAKQAEQRFENAQFYANREIYNRAIEEYQKGLDLSPDSWRMRVGLLKSQTLSAALENDIVGTIHDPELVQSLEADASFLSRNDPADPQLLGLRGILRSLDDDPKGADEWFSKAIKNEPGFAKAYNYRGMNFLNWQLEKDWPEQARKNFQEAAMLDRQFAWPYINLGVLSYMAAESTDDLQQANHYFEEAEKIDHEIPALYLDWAASLEAEGEIYVTERDGVEAKKHFVWALAKIEKAAKVNDGLADVQNNWGAILEAMDENGEAEKHFKLAVSLQPRFLRARKNLGELYEKLGRRKEALDSYKHWREAAQLLKANLERRAVKPLDSEVKDKLNGIIVGLQEKISETDNKIGGLQQAH